MTDPTLPGIPQDAIDHAANVERARSHIERFHGIAFPDDVDAFAEALTAAEVRGFAAGVESAKPAPVGRRNCWSCQHDYRDEDGASCCGSKTIEVYHWLGENVYGGSDMPSPDADNCPGWAPKETP